MFYVEVHCFFKHNNAWFTRLCLVEYEDADNESGEPTGRKIIIEQRGANSASVEQARQTALREVGM